METMPSDHYACLMQLWNIINLNVLNIARIGMGWNVMYYGYAVIGALLQILVRYTYSYAHMIVQTPVYENVTFAFASFTAVWVASCGEGLLFYYIETRDMRPVYYQAFLTFSLEVFMKCDGFQRTVDFVRERVLNGRTERSGGYRYNSNSIEHHSVRRVWEWCSFGQE